MGSNEAIILVYDMRGFTKVSSNDDIGDTLELINNLYKAVNKAYGFSWIKPMGDGGLIIRRYPNELQTDHRRDKAVETFNRMVEILTDYPIKTGWGMTRGTIYPTLHNDFFSKDINKASRLCDLARPSGCVIDYDDYHCLDDVIKFPMSCVELRGFVEPVKVWHSSDVELKGGEMWKQ